MQNKRLKKLLVFVLIPIIVLIGVVFIIKEFVLQETVVLIDHVPETADVWLWQHGQTVTPKISAILSPLGVNEAIIEVFHEKQSDIVVYQQAGKWYKIGASDITKNTPDQKNKDVLPLLQENEKSVVGYVNSEYLKERFGPALVFALSADGYYFFIEEEGRHVTFRLFEVETLVSIDQERTPQLYVPRNRVSGIITLPDTNTAQAVLQTIQTHLAKEASFEYPVVIKTALPDGTIMRERVAEPQLLTWERIDTFLYRLAFNREKSAELGVEDQLGELENPPVYYFAGNTIIWGEDVHSVRNESLYAPERVPYLYLYFEASERVSVSRVFGKSELFNWLQNLGVRSMIISEEGGIVEGELLFNN